MLRGYSNVKTKPTISRITRASSAYVTGSRAIRNDGQSMTRLRLAIVSLFGLPAVYYLITAWWIGSEPEEYFVQDGQWEYVTTKVEGRERKFWRTVLPAGGESTIIQDQPASIIANQFLYIPFHDAERGQKSIKLTAEHRPSKDANGRKIMRKWTPVDEMTLRTSYSRIRYTVKNLSPERQTFRLHTWRRFINDVGEQSIPTYTTGLCPPTRTPGQFELCVGAPTPAHSLPTYESVTLDVRHRYLWGLALGVMTLISLIGPLRILFALFPSGAAKRIREDLKNSKVNRSASARYRNRPSSSFERKRDISEMRKILKEKVEIIARLKQKLRALEQQHTGNVTNDVKRANDLEKRNLRMKELEEELAALRRGENEN